MYGHTTVEFQMTEPIHGQNPSKCVDRVGDVWDLINLLKIGSHFNRTFFDVFFDFRGERVLAWDMYECHLAQVMRCKDTYHNQGNNSLSFILLRCLQKVVPCLNC